MVTLFSNNNSLLNQFIAELRHEEIQKNRLRFRRNLERVGEIMAYEISKTFPYTNSEITTPLGLAEIPLLDFQPVLLTIMRAGIPFHQGFLNYFDEADSGYLAAYRHTKKSGELEIQKKYESVTNLNGKTVIMTDTMLATGKSLVLCCKELLAKYDIKELHIASVIASDEGLRHVQANIPQAKIWIAALDYELTAKSYIVPGLGDAGDLAYGEKE